MEMGLPPPGPVMWSGHRSVTAHQGLMGFEQRECVLPLRITIAEATNLERKGFLGSQDGRFKVQMVSHRLSEASMTHGGRQ
jgi:hypothetical protein